MGNLRKRRDVFHYLREKQYSVYLLQDTHFDEKIERYVRSEWGYNCYFASCNSQSRGVAILLNNNFEFKVKKVYKDEGGNFLFVLLETMDMSLLLVSVYGPNRDSPDFYEDLQKYIGEVDYTNIVMGGDFNLVLDPNLDYYNYKHVNNPNAANKVENMILDLDITDIWRDLNPEIRRYTWRRPNPLQQSRLDFFLISESIVQNVEDADILHGYRSDHSMIVLNFSFGKLEKRRSYWKLNTSLLKDSKYVEEIRQEIRDVIDEYAVPVYDRNAICNIPERDLQFVISDQLFLDFLLMKLRSKSIAYASMKKKNTLEKEHGIEREIEQLEKKRDQNAEDNHLEDLRKELAEIRNHRMEGVLLRSRARWIAEGEKVTKYFCSLEKRNYVNKCMKKIIDKHGSILKDQNKISNEVSSFYSSLYKKRIVERCEITELVNDIPCLTEVEANTIEGKITLEEASFALKHMKNKKSPGTDGFSAEFFKFFWKQLGDFVVRSLNEGFERGEMSNTQKEGIVVCIPKGDKPREYIKNWRPISLLNTIYKIGSTCIANRIKGVLPGLINEDQTGFIANRYMGDNIRLIYDIMHYLDDNNLPGLLLCIDFEKAFDSLDWTFMRKVFKAFGFGNSICRWIETFYAGIKSTVVVNGAPSPWFPVERGCRQGDPISPYIFILCVEIMGLMIRENKNIKGININNELHKITQFADDTQTVSEGDSLSFEETIKTVVTFGNKSGLQMNSEKTQAIWLGSKKGSPIKLLPNMKICWNPDKFKILGIWLTVDLKECVDINFNDKLSEIKTLYKIWIKRSITPVGRVAVLKSLILSKLTHLWMLLPDPPDAFVDSLQKHCYKFIWNRKQDRISRKTVVKSVKKGGLGLFDLKQFVNGLKITWIRKLMKSNHKWKNVIVTVLPIIKDIEMYGPCLTINKEKVNAFWQDVFHAYREFGRKIIVKQEEELVTEPLFCNENIKVGNSKIYYMKWVEKGVLKVSHLLRENGSFLSHLEFNRKYVLRTDFITYYGCVQAIKKYSKQMNIEIHSNNARDQNKTIETILSASRGAKIYYDILIEDNKKPNCCDKWDEKLQKGINWRMTFLKIHKIQEVKLKWFQMRLIHRIIAVNKTLVKMKITNDSRCSFCRKEVDSIEHLFWRCDHAQQFWNAFTQYINRCEHAHNIRFDEELVLFGNRTGFESDDVFDLILLLAKHFMYRCYLEKTLPKIEVFSKSLTYRFNTEKHIAFQDMEFVSFRTKWIYYMPLIEGNVTMY